jgi:hypothetical protein
VGLGLALSTVLAFAVAFGFNFTAARQWAFARTACEGQARRQLMRYLVLVAINLCSTVLIVVGLAAAGMPYLGAKVVAAGLNAVGNFFAYRHWVFAAPPVLEGPDDQACTRQLPCCRTSRWPGRPQRGSCAMIDARSQAGTSRCTFPVTGSG